MYRTAGRSALVALGLLSGCHCNGKTAAKQTSTATGSATARDASAAELAHQQNRDELLRKGDPAMMKPAPTLDPNAAALEASQSDLIKPVSKDVMMVKSLKVDLAQHRIEIPGTVDHSNVLEFIAVGERGKAYESLFTVDATAVELRLALTLLGHDGVLPDDKGDLPPPGAGETMHVAVRVGDDERPLSAFLVDRRTGKAPGELTFQVVGFRDADKSSALANPQFISLVSHELFAPLRVVGDLGNPYASAAQGLVGAPNLPAQGTPVTLILEDNP